MGLKTITSLKEQASEKKISLLKLISENFIAGKKQTLVLREFNEMIMNFINQIKKKSPHEIIQDLIEKINLVTYYSDQKSDEAYERWNNIEELISTLAEFTELNPENNLKHF